MTLSPGARRTAPPAPLIDPQKLLFSLSSFLAASLTLVITFMVSLPRPWWALLTVYVTAQPMAGPFVPRCSIGWAGSHWARW
jgi:hypothetical protein